jgi:uncharacterized protein (DUF305 family)
MTTRMTRSSIAIAMFMFAAGSAYVGLYAETHTHNDHTGAPDWSELLASMDKMHMAMSAIERSGDTDVDFARLMLPHHQGAVDMAKVQLLYGKDPQMRRLAQEIVIDQQLEIELMQRWLKTRTPANRSPKNN